MFVLLNLAMKIQVRAAEYHLVKVFDSSICPALVRGHGLRSSTNKEYTTGMDIEANKSFAKGNIQVQIARKG